MAVNIYKPVQSSIFSDNTVRTSQTVQGLDLSYTKCDREPSVPATDGWKANYFSSFNLPYTLAAMPSGDTSSSYMGAHNTELYQLNVESIVICPIPESYYSEMIDGRTVVMEVPQAMGGSISAKTVVSSTYSNLTLKSDNILLGENVAFLFSDDINTPFTGTTQEGGIVHSANTSWEVTSYLNRPTAIRFTQLSSSDYASDARVWATVKTALGVPNGYPTIGNQGKGYNYDIPVGFIALDKGYIVFTHPDIVNNIPFSSGTQIHYDSDGAGVVTGDAGSSVDLIAFTGSTGTTNSTVDFTDVSYEHKMSVVCLALPGEFYMSNNKTWNYSANYAIYQANQTDYDSIYITQVGLYNSQQDLIAIAKFDRPIEKTYTNIINFNLEINM